MKPQTCSEKDVAKQFAVTSDHFFLFFETHPYLRNLEHVIPLAQSRFTYEVAPVFVLLEYVTLKKMREIIGWQDGRGDGIFSPGE